MNLTDEQTFTHQFYQDLKVSRGSVSVHVEISYQNLDIACAILLMNPTYFTRLHDSIISLKMYPELEKCLNLHTAKRPS